MEEIINAPFKLDRFMISEFNIKREPNEKGNINIQINPSGAINKSDSTFILNLDVDLKDDTGSFEIKMECFGQFSFKEIEGAEVLSNFFFTNAPAIMYPYIRSYITAITALTGLEAVYLPVMNLVGLKDKLKANTLELE